MPSKFRSRVWKILCGYFHLSWHFLEHNYVCFRYLPAGKSDEVLKRKREEYRFIYHCLNLFFFSCMKVISSIRFKRMGSSGKSTKSRPTIALLSHQSPQQTWIAFLPKNSEAQFCVLKMYLNCKVHCCSQIMASQLYDIH